MAVSRWRISTPFGDFRLEVTLGGRDVLSGEDQERAQRIWFFAQRQLQRLAPDALEAAVRLCAELGWPTDWQAVARIDRQAVEHLARELETAILGGLLALRAEPTFHVVASHDSQPSPPQRTAPPEPSSKEPEYAWIELELRNQRDEPVAFRSFRVLQQGSVVREAMTNDTGFSRVENLGPGPCEIEFPDFDEADFHHHPALPGGSPAAAVGPVTRSSPPATEQESGEPWAGAEQELST